MQEKIAILLKKPHHLIFAGQVKVFIGTIGTSGSFSRLTPYRHITYTYVMLSVKQYGAGS